jgi:N-methylhydantoinase B
MFIEYYGYRPDTGGPGKYRGGVGVSRVYRFLEPSTGICLVYKTKSPPWALAGGHEGLPNRIVLNGGTEREVITAGSYNYLEAGETLANDTGGGGGYGDPLERDPLAVAKDVRNELVSVAAARDDYGVVLDATGAPDVAATEARRAELRGRR